MTSYPEGLLTLIEILTFRTPVVRRQCGEEVRGHEASAEEAGCPHLQGVNFTTLF